MTRYLLPLAASLALCGLAPASEAAVSVYLSAGATCSGGNSAAFVPGGPAVTVSLCMTATTEQTCGYSVGLVSAVAAEDAQFHIAGRTLAPIFSDRNLTDAQLQLPRAIVNAPGQSLDLGATVSASAPVAPGTGRLLATYKLAPQATAQNASYVIGLSPTSEITGAQDGNCATSKDSPVQANFTLTRQGEGAAADRDSPRTSRETPLRSTH